MQGPRIFGGRVRGRRIHQKFCAFGSSFNDMWDCMGLVCSWSGSLQFVQTGKRRLTLLNVVQPAVRLILATREPPTLMTMSFFFFFINIKPVFFIEDAHPSEHLVP